MFQPAIDFCIERLRAGEWVHIFPEGRVNVDKEPLRYKWGVGRLVAACAAGACAPLILPVWHEGMDQVRSRLTSRLPLEPSRTSKRSVSIRFFTNKLARHKFPRFQFSILISRCYRTRSRTC